MAFSLDCDYNCDTGFGFSVYFWTYAFTTSLQKNEIGTNLKDLCRFVLWRGRIRKNLHDFLMKTVFLQIIADRGESDNVNVVCAFVSPNKIFSDFYLRKC